MKRRINVELLKKCVKKNGHHNAVAKASVASGVSVSTIQQLMSNTYPSQPKEDIRVKLSEAFGVPENELFPVVRSGKNLAS